MSKEYKMSFVKCLVLLLITTSFLYSETLTEELERSFKSSKTTNLEDEAKRLSALGSINHQKGDYKAAMTYYEKSLSIREKMGSIENLSYANTLFLSAIASHKSGDSCKALQKMDNVIIVYKILAPREKLEIAQKEIDTVYKPSCNNTRLLLSKK